MVVLGSHGVVTFPPPANPPIQLQLALSVENYPSSRKVNRYTHIVDAA